MAISARDFSVGKIVSIRAEAANQKQGVALSLGHIYEITEEAVQKRQSQRVQSELPRSFDMDAYPNPFNPSTTIAFELPQPEHVTLRIYNIRGQVVRELLNEFRSSGKHRIPWDGRDDLGQNVASGMYLVQLQTTTQTLRTKILRIR